jgi:aspartyl/asparaginyl beta-hydroxylase (cupin superfamily)
MTQYKQYPFLQKLEEGWEAVLEELDNLLYNEAANDKTYFSAWPETDIYEGTWDVFGLYLNGKKFEKNCSFCPKTTALIESIPGITTAGFSALAPDTYISPHVGYTDEVLRCHLGLITPKAKPEVPQLESDCLLVQTCGLKVDQSLYNWVPGKAFVFDDTKEHSAWNYGDRTRFILLIDFKR